MGLADQIFWYPNEYLHTLSVEVNKNLPSVTDVIQIAPTSQLEVEVPRAFELPTPKSLFAFLKLEKIL